MIWFLLFSVLVTPEALADTQFDVVRASIIHIEPDRTYQQANNIGEAVLKYSKLYNLDWKIMVAIIDQESNFRQDPQHCLDTKIHCVDLGIAQINWHTWGKKLKLDKLLLLKDIDYNIQIMAKILSILKDQYGHERTWVSRYHSFTPSFRKAYDKKIINKYLRIKDYADGYIDKSNEKEK